MLHTVSAQEMINVGPSRFKLVGTGTLSSLTLLSKNLIQMGNEFRLEYNFHPTSALTASLSNLVHTKAKSNFYGYSLGLRYCLSCRGYSQSTLTSNITVNTSPAWPWFLHLEFIKKSIRISSDHISFYGLGFGAGIEYFIYQQYFIQTEISYHQLSGDMIEKSDVSYQAINMAMGLGYNF